MISPGQDPCTGLVVNMSPCPECRASLAKHGRHRAHECQGGTRYLTVFVFCDCECRSPTTKFDPPYMSLSSLEGDERARLVGGRLDGVTVELSKTPLQLRIDDVIYERIDDPDTGEWLGGYVAQSDQA